METHTSSYIVEVALGVGGLPFPGFVNIGIDCHRAPHLDYKGSAGFKGGIHIYIYTYVCMYVYIYIIPFPGRYIYILAYLFMMEYKFRAA